MLSKTFRISYNTIILKNSDIAQEITLVINIFVKKL